MGLLQFLFGKRKSVSQFQYTVPESLIKTFINQAQEKIVAEGWGRQGRKVEVKTRNFVQCWITEEAWKQLLIKNGKWFRYRGLYFGDALGAGADFTIKLNGKETTLGIRCVEEDSLQQWKSVAYPDDRFRTEKDKIAEYHIVCSQKKGRVIFYGAISKNDLLQELTNSSVKYSAKNQEKFRIIPIEKFTKELLHKLLQESGPA